MEIWVCFLGNSYASSMENNAAGGYQNNGPSTSNANVSDFPDFTFDDSDLLGSGDMSQAGGSVSTVWFVCGSYGPEEGKISWV